MTGKKKVAPARTELSVKAVKLQDAAIVKAKKVMAIAENTDIAKAMAHSKAEMKVINAVKATNEELNHLRAGIEANSEKGAELKEQFSVAFKRLFPAEYAKETTLKAIKKALIEWVCDRKETTINGIVVKTYEQGLQAYQVCIDTQIEQMVASATNTQ